MQIRGGGFFFKYFSHYLKRFEDWLKELSGFSVRTNIWLFPPSVLLVCSRPISSETSGLWQGGLVMATHSCNMDGAFHISVVNKGNRSRSLSISTSHDLPRSWQRQKGEERGREGESYIDHVFKWLLLNSMTVNPSHTLDRPITPYSCTQRVTEKMRGVL